MKILGLFSFASLVLVTAAGCASTPTSTTTVTSADVSAPAARESTPSSTFPGARPSGQLVCHASSVEEGTIELYLTWGSDGAKGTLRRKAPSGMITEQTVHAERVRGAIVADDVLSTDLVVHAAMVREHKGRNYVRLGDWKQGWTPCE